MTSDQIWCTKRNAPVPIKNNTNDLLGRISLTLMKSYEMHKIEFSKLLFIDLRYVTQLIGSESKIHWFLCVINKFHRKIQIKK